MNMKVPTLEEVEQQVLKMNFAVIPQEFYDYYEDQDWMVGEKQMSSWKYTLRNWHKKELKYISDRFGWDAVENFTMPTEEKVCEVFSEINVDLDNYKLPFDCEPECICLDYRDNKEWRNYPYWSKFIAARLDDFGIEYDHLWFKGW